MEPIDIFITTYERQHFVRECIEYLVARTKTPYRLTILDNGGNDWVSRERFNMEYQIRHIPLYALFGNTGIHFAWNVAASLAKGEYFITSDPDLLVPDLSGVILGRHTVEKAAPNKVIYDPDFGQADWLERMIKLMDERPDYGAISMMPHIFIGAAGIDPNDPEDVKERNMCGAVMRIMRTEAVRSARGWDLKIEAGRNHEERTICSRLHDIGFKTGICSRIRAYHNFGKNWGYPEEFSPQQQKHNPELAEEILRFDNRDAYDTKTWLPR